jgi:hypothetical protein
LNQPLLQEEYTLANGDPNAPLGDWTGLRRQLTAPEREEMRQACKTLCEDAKYVLIGFNAISEEQALASMDQWLEGLGLPRPIEVVLTDDDMDGRFLSKVRRCEAIESLDTDPEESI